MAPRERRIQTTGPLVAALVGAGALGLLYFKSDPAIVAATAAEQPVVIVSAEDVRVRNDPHVILTREVRGIIGEALDLVATKGVDRGSCHVSVLVKELGVEGAMVEVEADRSVRPASNLKLATTAVALALLGHNASFETSFQSDAIPFDGVLPGDLVVRAGGDPLFDPALDGEVGPLLAVVGRELRAAGIDKVRGDLVLDLGSYGDAQPAPGWPSAGQRWKDYCALASGFTANAGCVNILVRSGSAGLPAEVYITPVGHGARLDVDVTTGKRGSLLDMKAVVSPKLIKVWGEIPEDVVKWRGRYAHPDPVGLFGSVLRHSLAKEGVLVQGETRLERAAKATHSLATLRTPVVSVLAPINTDSNNAVADQLFFKVGSDVSGSGDRFGGADAALSALAGLGLNPEGYKQIDGSGLSRNNRLSARQIVALLDAVLGGGGPAADAFMQSLALSGRSGTLQDRMNGTGADGMIRAKTGFIGGASALSGVAMTNDEGFFAFSILVEYPVTPGLNRQVWKPMQDQICEVLVRGP